MSDYQFLEDVVNIKSVSKDIQKVDLLIEESDSKGNYRRS